MHTQWHGIILRDAFPKTGDAVLLRANARDKLSFVSRGDGLWCVCVNGAGYAQERLTSREAMMHPYFAAVRNAEAQGAAAN